MKRILVSAAIGVAALGALAATPASYPGGDEELSKFLASTVRYPEFARDNGIEGTVSVQFTVREDGTIAEPKIVRPLDPDLEEEALRVVKSMPAWTPATDDSGRPVAAPVTLPVHFRLS